MTASSWYTAFTLSNLVASQSCGRSFDNVCFDILANVGVSRAAGRRDQEGWWHELKPKSRAQVEGCASSVGCTRCWAVLGRVYCIVVRTTLLYKAAEYMLYP